MSWLTPDLIDILLSILKAVVILLVVVTCGAFMSFGERRLLGLFQNRYGPNRVGWGGSLRGVRPVAGSGGAATGSGPRPTRAAAGARPRSSCRALIAARYAATVARATAGHE